MLNNEFDRIIWCLQQGFPLPTIAALLSERNTVRDAWDVWHDKDDSDGFHVALLTVCELTASRCIRCAEMEDFDDTYAAQDGGRICLQCVREAFTECYNCELYVLDPDVQYAADSDNPYCNSCISECCHWCENCEEWSRHGHEHEDEDGWCDCEAPHKTFRFPANGDGTVGNDERLLVTLPAGTIDDAGLGAIRRLLLDVDTIADNYMKHAILEQVLEAVGDKWQGNRGNFTRRLSRELHAGVLGPNYPGHPDPYRIKLPSKVVSEVGNLARAHSSESSEWAVEFTRNLNMDASKFCHEDSCWWGSYYPSRCALKNWGGMGMRTFDEDDCPDGRAWVQPLRTSANGSLSPTHDALNAHAYVIYNCYEELSGAKAARIVAHLTGRTYCKVMVHAGADNHYINGDTGWLVADEATCVATDSITFGSEVHHNYDANDQEVAA